MKAFRVFVADMVIAWSAFVAVLIYPKDMKPIQLMRAIDGHLSQRMAECDQKIEGRVL